MLWQFSDGTGWSVSTDGVHFQLSEVDGQKVASHGDLPIERIFSTRIHPVEGPCLGATGPAIFPGEFEYCPECRVKLPPPELHHNQLWRPPFGSAESARTTEELLENVGDIETDSCEELSLPAGFGSFRFLIAKLGAAQRLLFALDLPNGTVAVYNPKGNKWRELKGHLAGSRQLPDWAWTAISSPSEKYLFVPDDEGFKRIAIDWSTGSVRIVDSQQGRCIAGPGVISENLPGKPSVPDDLICLPLADRDGKVSVRVWSEAAPNEWNQVVLDGALPPDEIFGQPVRPRRRLLVWPGRGGVLRLQFEGTSPLPVASWRPWPAAVGRKVIGLPELGPAWRDPEGAVWQFCEERGGGRRGDEVTMQRINVDNLTDVTEIPHGDVLSTGYASFSRDHDHWRTPEEFVDNEPVRTDIRLPLLQFGVTIGSVNTGLAAVAHLRCPTDFDSTDISDAFAAGKGVRAKMAVAVSGPSQPPRWLSRPGAPEPWMDVDVYAFSQGMACVYDGYFWLGLTLPTRLYRWPVKLRSK